MPPRTPHPLSSRYRSQSVARVPESHTSCVPPHPHARRPTLRLEANCRLPRRLPQGDVRTCGSGEGQRFNVPRQQMPRVGLVRPYQGALKASPRAMREGASLRSSREPRKPVRENPGGLTELEGKEFVVVSFQVRKARCVRDENYEPFAGRCARNLVQICEKASVQLGEGAVPSARDRALILHSIARSQGATQRSIRRGPSARSKMIDPGSQLHDEFRPSARQKWIACSCSGAPAAATCLLN